MSQRPKSFRLQDHDDDDDDDDDDTDESTTFIPSLHNHTAASHIMADTGSSSRGQLDAVELTTSKEVKVFPTFESMSLKGESLHREVYATATGNLSL